MGVWGRRCAVLVSQALALWAAVGLCRVETEIFTGGWVGGHTAHALNMKVRGYPAPWAGERQEETTNFYPGSMRVWSRSLGEWHPEGQNPALPVALALLAITVPPVVAERLWPGIRKPHARSSLFNCVLQVAALSAAGGVLFAWVEVETSRYLPTPVGARPPITLTVTHYQWWEVWNGPRRLRESVTPGPFKSLDYWNRADPAMWERRTLMTVVGMAFGAAGGVVVAIRRPKSTPPGA